MNTIMTLFYLATMLGQMAARSSQLISAAIRHHA